MREQLATATLKSKGEDTTGSVRAMNTAFIYKEKFCQVYRIQSSADSIDFVTSQLKYFVLFNVRYSFANPA